MEPLRTNEEYRHLRQLTANDNQILSMSDLIGSNFMKNKPTTLNLQFNNLTIFDLNVLREIIDEDYSPSAINYLFAGNPWTCDCDTISDIQDFIVEKSSYLRDHDHLECHRRKVNSKSKSSP